ncbi:MAG: hypothetical protein HQM12_23860 [SAR324 cluster bacterium]|nr:hypothetical protein [SAR324 cluster bacterium]
MLDWQNAYQNVDALAIHGYFSGEMFNPANESAILGMSVDDIFNELNNGGLGDKGALFETNSYYLINYSLAQARGLALIGYEGGQYLTPDVFSTANQNEIYNLFAEANHDARMGAAYLTNFSNWKNAGGSEFFHFTNIAYSSVHGMVGALEYQTQPRSEAPKFDAIMSFIEQNDCWWTNCER